MAKLRQGSYFPLMVSPDDFQYALENTRVLLEPERRIETFGGTHFRFLLVSELMDQAQAVRVRDGSIEAERPRIVAPHHFQKMLLEGFGEQARQFADWLEGHADLIKILRYGFTLRKTDIEEHILHEPVESVLGRLEADLRASGDDRTVLISGVDDAWEVCLLKFTSEVIKRSSGANLEDWQKRGLL